MSQIDILEDAPPAAPALSLALLPPALTMAGCCSSASVKVSSLATPRQDDKAPELLAPAPAPGDAGTGGGTVGEVGEI